MDERTYFESLGMLMDIPEEFNKKGVDLQTSQDTLSMIKVFSDIMLADRDNIVYADFYVEETLQIFDAPVVLSDLGKTTVRNAINELHENKFLSSTVDMDEEEAMQIVSDCLGKFFKAGKEAIMKSTEETISTSIMEDDFKVSFEIDIQNNIGINYYDMRR